MQGEGKILPGTGRWHAQHDGGAGSGESLMQPEMHGFNRPLHHFVVPLPVPGRI
jgi:hypothetical protein